MKGDTPVETRGGTHLPRGAVIWPLFGHISQHQGHRATECFKAEAAKKKKKGVLLERPSQTSNLSNLHDGSI